MTMYGNSDLREFKSYTDWVHDGVSAPVCAFSKTSSITLGLLVQMLFQIHFVYVAKSFLQEMTNPRPDPAFDQSSVSESDLEYRPRN